MAAKMTVPRIRNHKVSEGADPLVMLTAYDAPTARMVDSAGADIILVGDSVAMVVLGYEDTLQVTIDDIAYHTAAVTRANPSAFVVADMPWMSYHVSKEETVINAAKLIRAGADAVKLEGGRRRLPMIEALVDAEIPVMGHLGLTPQSVNVMGGYKVQAKNTKAALDLVSAAKSLVHAGCFSVVLEGVPSPVAGMVTEAIDVATIGIGAGPYCDGQVLVLHDVLGIEQRVLPKFVRRYADLHGEGVKALSEFAKDVRTGKFPGDEESYQLHDDVVDEIKPYGTI